MAPNCHICGKLDEEKPMCFRGEPYCSDRHRKRFLVEVEYMLGCPTKDENTKE